MPATWAFHPYAIPLRRPYRWAKGEQVERRGLLVSCDLDGATGWGEVAPPPHLEFDPAAAASRARKLLRIALAQDDVPAALDAAEVGPRLRAGVAGAWLDAKARSAGQPLGAFVVERLGLDLAPAAKVPVNALCEALPPDRCADAARRALASGYATLKVKSDGDAAVDAQRLRAIRSSVGDAVRLRLDANESYPAADAPRILAGLAPFGLEYVEQPTPAANRADLVHLLEASPVPIALDESVTSWPAVASLARLRPVLVVKPQRLGGIDRAARLIAKATDARLRCVVTNSLETAVGRAHALHAASLLPVPMLACGLATQSFLARDVSDAPEPSGGMVAVPRAPGLGLDAHLEGLHAAAP